MCRAKLAICKPTSLTPGEMPSSGCCCSAGSHFHWPFLVSSSFFGLSQLEKMGTSQQLSANRVFWLPCYSEVNELGLPCGQQHCCAPRLWHGSARSRPVHTGLNPAFSIPHRAPGPGSWWADMAAAQPSLG